MKVKNLYQSSWLVGRISYSLHVRNVQPNFHTKKIDFFLIKQKIPHNFRILNVLKFNPMSLKYLEIAVYVTLSCMYV